MTGTLIRDSERGYGFIRRDDAIPGDRDVFVHANDAGGELPPVGTRMQFDQIEAALNSDRKVTVDRPEPLGK